MGEQRGQARDRARGRVACDRERGLVEQEFDEPRVPGHAKPWLFIGPPRKLGGPLIEVMVEIVPPRGMVVFHVMEA